MRRVGEKILVWLGLLLQFALIFILGVIAPFLNDKSFKKDIVKDVKREVSSDQLSNSQIHNIVSSLNQWIIYLIGIAIVVAIIALLAALFINKFPKTTGGIFIILAIVVVISFNWIATICWLIAGIMLIVRNRKKANKKARTRR
ncbi:DUF4064 domain-containing protein [Staphylococcus sp. SQ8-PEA]|uniref:DUF4064 domain-containing protein n=1 Tax=Staphylococcus marylandisciuri TaxID=2981529 RepID=A0ABT2QN22_9STAP|nr:DUF4064 domain-containing protein [Staphylococcus marylandisciuri]MCU5745373.1 DUF4064 domain-containing protein [Staphylococcus marylandisciuri]